MDQNVEKGAMAEERGEHRDSIGDAGKIWRGADGESLNKGTKREESIDDG